MLIADFTQQQFVIVLALVALVLVWAWRRRVAASAQLTGREFVDRRKSIIEAEQASQERISKLEVRLHNYGEQVDGRLQTRLATLDQLMVAADREIIRLSEILDASRHAPDGEDAAGERPLSPQSRRMIVHLWDAGYSSHQIGALVNELPERIQKLVEEERNTDAA